MSVHAAPDRTPPSDTLAAHLLDLEALENRGYSIRSLARHLRIPESVLRRLRRGERVRPKTGEKVAAFFGVAEVVDLYKPPPPR